LRVEPRWPTLEEVSYANARQLALYGGLSGLRDAALLQSALSGPINRWHYGEDDLLLLGVAFAVSIARNHPFIDGNKRTALMTMIYFLQANGYRVDAPDDTSLGQMLEAIITRDATEDDFADLLGEYVRTAG
jgi:death-on-curing protein